MSDDAYDRARVLTEEFQRRIEAGDDPRMVYEWLKMQMRGLDIEGWLWAMTFQAGFKTGQIAVLMERVEELKEEKSRRWRP